MIDPRLGHEFPFLLVGAFRRLIDELHRELAAAGHPDLRPVHAVALQAIEVSGSRITAMAQTVGVSKQAMAKTVGRLDELGYVNRAVDSADRRAQIVRLSPRGRDALSRSGVILAALSQRHADVVGEDQFMTAVSVLRAIRADGPAFEHFEGWFGGR